ncbi:MAG TPA: HDIG domain-containing protein [Candidatus Cloacimonetes bacterium]|nr:HDIG domain-containing protein [Candidatus Cloacimonadota bacterium]
MNKSKITIITLTSILIAILHFAFSPYRSNSYEYDLKLGQIAEKDIISPFEFSIRKSDETITAEQEAAAAKIKPVYKVSENLKFNAQKNLDFIFQHFINSELDSEKIKEKLQQNGFLISSRNIRNLLDEKFRTEIYTYLTEELSGIFDVGIYKDNISYEKIKLSKGKKIREYPLSRLYSIEEAKHKLIIGTRSQKEKDVISELANIILITNIVVDNESTKLEKQKARENVTQTIGKVLKNEKIISKNSKVTTTELQKLNSLMNAQKNREKSKNKYELFLSSSGSFILSLFLIFLFYFILNLFFDKNMLSVPRVSVFSGSFLISVILTIFINNILKVPSLIIPFGFSVILISLVFNPHIGLIFNFFNLIFVVCFLNWSVLNPAMLCLSTIGGIIALKRMKKKQEYYALGIYIFISFIILNIAISLLKFENIAVFSTRLFYGFISIIVSIIGLIMVIPVIERKLHMATKQILLELLDFDNPLLKKMSQITPGTYHHSLIVGNLAESAAEAIGANYLLARVGSYYHDIGKLNNPQFYIENNSNSSELHDKMMANESSVLIRNHISDGITLAKKNKLPRQILDIIEQHHGTGQIRYFYNKAIETNLDIDEDQFYYLGPKPQSKEAAIVMIADIVESTTKSLDDLSEKAIQKVLDDTIIRLINDGQLDETPITMKELDTIKKYMMPIIMGVYRKRLEYPEV